MAGLKMAVASLFHFHSPLLGHPKMIVPCPNPVLALPTRGDDPPTANNRVPKCGWDTAAAHPRTLTVGGTDVDADLCRCRERHSAH